MHLRFRDYGLIGLAVLSFLVAFALIYANQRQFTEELSAYFDTRQGIYDETLIERSQNYLLAAVSHYSVGEPAAPEVLDNLDLAYAFMNIGEYLKNFPCVPDALQQILELRDLFVAGSEDLRAINALWFQVLDCEQRISAVKQVEKKHLASSVIERVEHHRLATNLAIIASYLVGLLLWGLHEAQRRKGVEILREKLDWQSRAMVDSLTGALNRAALNELLSKHLSHWPASNQPLTLFMYDVDRFKEYNDQFGHVAGDQALQKVSAAINAVLRADEQLFRYGGEEFLVVTRVDNVDQLNAMGERMLTAVRNLKIDHPRSEYGVVTISIGRLTMAARSYTFETLLAEVDACLYRAKSQGRNRLVS